MEIIETISAKDVAGKALGVLLETHKNKPILLMLSGGSAFTILDFVPSAVLGPNITVTVLDERYSTDPQVNNFAQLEQTNFYKSCIGYGVNFISTKVSPNESIEDLRNRFDLALHTWKEQNRDGVVVATMGIGADGHTAGIFPGDYRVNFNGEDWVVEYSVPKTVNQYTDRVTVTNTFLRNQVNEAIVYAVGHDKRAVIQKIQTNNFSSQEIPAGIFTKMNNVKIFTQDID